MERERSCCRGENVIKYPSSWENALASAGLGNGFIPVLPQGGRNRVYRYSRAGAHPRVASLGLCPIYLQPPPYGFTLIRPSVRTGAPSPWKGEGWAGGPVCRPYGVYRSRPSFFVGAGHWPARRCTRRAESWFRPVSLAFAGQFTFSRPTGCRDLHGRPHGAPTEGGRKFPKRAADSRPTKWVATCPLIRLAFARHLPPRGRLSGDRKGRPYGVSSTSTVGSVKPGAEFESHRMQFWGSQAPVGREETQAATQILRAGNTLPTPRDNPRNGGLGESRHWRTKFASAVSPSVFWFLFHGEKELAPQDETLQEYNCNKKRNPNDSIRRRTI